MKKTCHLRQGFKQARVTGTRNLRIDSAADSIVSDRESGGYDLDALTTGENTGMSAGNTPDDLASILTAWPTLPLAIRAGMLATVQAAAATPREAGA